MPLEKDAIVNESHNETSHSGQAHIIYDPKIFPQPSSELFNADYWQAEGAIVGKAKGRGITWFFQHQKAHYVLRHYYRGGLIGRFIRDHYLNINYKKSRAYREFILLQALYQKGLPVPSPAACLIRRSLGIYCVNDIITRRIENAQSLVQRLSQGQLSSDMWQKIGHTLRAFHDAEVYHHDLNAHNILLDDNDKVWVIDFDQGEIRKEQGSKETQWKQDNIERFKRSLNKEQGKQLHFFWTEADWQRFYEGYRSVN